MLRSYSNSPFTLHGAGDTKRPRGQVRETQRQRDRVENRETEGKESQTIPEPGVRGVPSWATSALVSAPVLESLLALRGEKPCLLDLRGP